MTNYVNVDGIVFAPINNIKNSFCYHLTVVQLFHISPTFNNCMQQLDSMQIDNFYKLMLNPFAVYSKVSENNYMEVYQELKEAYNVLIDIVVDDFAKNGYSPFFVIYYYIFPILNHLFPNEVRQIAEEIGAQSIHFNTTRPFYTNIIVNNPFVKQEYQNLMLQLCDKMTNNLGDYIVRNKVFKAGILEVYPEQHAVDGGHALFLLRNAEKFYIFDDDSTIELFEKYVNTRANNINKICIHTDDENAVNCLQQLWGSNILTKRVNNRYEILNRRETKSEEIKQIATSFVELHNAKNEFLQNQNMSGGDEQPKSYKTLFVTFLIISIVLIIILIIESIIVLSKRAKASETYDCPCRRKERFGHLF